MREYDRARMTQLTERGERTGRRRTAYSLILGVILLTIPCYLLGFALLWIARPNQSGFQLPTATVAATIPSVATQAPLPATPTQFNPAQASATSPAAPTQTAAARTATPEPATATALPTITPTAPPSPTATETATPPLPPTDTATPIPLPTDTLAPLVPLVTDTPGLPTDTPTPAP